MLDPRFLVQLAEIVDRGSLSRAARSLGVPQPTLSRNIKILESQVGAPVLERGRMGAAPTEIGVALAREGRRIRDSLNEAALQHRQWRSGLEGRLRIGVGTMLAHSLMPQFLASPLVASWNVALKIDVAAADQMLARLKAQELDLALTQMDPLLAQQGLSLTSIFEETVGFYVGDRHPLARRRTIAIRDLARHDFVTTGAFSGVIDDAFASVGLPPPVRKMEFDGDVAMALHLVASGRYVAAMPDFLMGHLCDDRRFVRLAVPYQSAPRVVAASVRREMDGHPLIRSFQKRFSAFVGQLASIQK